MTQPVTNNGQLFFDTASGNGSLPPSYSGVINASEVVNDTAPSLGLTVGAALTTLLSDIFTLAGTANQIIITPSGDGTTLTFSTPQNLSTSSTVQFGNTTLLDTTIRHLIGSGSTPSIAALGTGAGTSPTSSIAGTDLVCVFNLTPGTSPAGSSANVVQINYTVPLGSTPTAVLMIPLNRSTWALQSATTTACTVVSSTSAHFILQSGTSTGLTAGVPYSWAFITIGT